MSNQRKDTRELVDERIAKQGCGKAEGNADDCRDDDRQGREFEGCGEGLRQIPRHGIARQDRDTEIPMQQATQINEELLIKWQIKAKPRPHGLIGLWIGKLADDCSDRTGRHHTAYDKGDAEQDEEADDQLQKTMPKPAQ